MDLPKTPQGQTVRLVIGRPNQRFERAFIGGHGAARRAFIFATHLQVMQFKLDKSLRAKQGAGIVDGERAKQFLENLRNAAKRELSLSLDPVHTLDFSSTLPGPRERQASLRPIIDEQALASVTR